MKINQPEILQIKTTRGSRRAYEFFSGDKIFGKMHYLNFFSQAAIAIINGQTWKLQRRGLWKPYIELLHENGKVPLTRLPFNWNYRLKYTGSNSDIYEFRQVNCWKNSWIWFDDKKNPVVEFKSRIMSKSNRGIVLVHQKDIPDVEVMILLGWFMIKSYEMDSVAVAAVV